MKEFNLTNIGQAIKGVSRCELDNNSHSAWLGLGNHIYNLKHVINEFVDNAVASLIACKRRFKSTKQGDIHISITKQGNEFVILIEDNGLGINNIANAFSLGGNNNKLHTLNVHGHGMKISLATVDKSNKRWKVFTRLSDDVEKKQYHLISAPYAENLEVLTIDSNKQPWPGKYDGSGTIIEFICHESTFNTLQEGIGGKASDSSCVGYLVEQLGYVYRNDIENNNIRISVEFNGKLNQVKPIRPNFVKGRNTGKNRVFIELENGKAVVEYIFGEIEESNFKTVYKCNQNSSGVELRINGRLVLDRLFTEIWAKHRHNSYNGFIGIVNIISDEPECLPKTNTAKNGIDKSDPVYKALLDWIRSFYPTPLKRSIKILREEDLVIALEKKLDKEIQAVDKRIQRELCVFQSCFQQVAVDLYCFDGKKTTIYEAKKEQGGPLDLYQLRMYWDGAIQDQLTIDEGVLIASSFSENLQEFVNYLNSCTDSSGNHYNFRLSTWSDEGVLPVR